MTVLSPHIILHSARFRSHRNAILDKTVRLTEGIRGPALGHEIVLQGEEDDIHASTAIRIEKEIENGGHPVSQTAVESSSGESESNASRKDTVMGDNDIAHVIFGAGGWLFVRSGAIILMRNAGESWGIGEHWVEEYVVLKGGWRCVDSAWVRGKERFVIGGHDGVFVTSMVDDVEQGAKMQFVRELARQNCVAVAVADEVWVNDEERAFVAAALGTGVVCVYDILGGLVWQLNGFRFPHVSCLKWEGTSLRGAFLSLLIAGANGVMVLSWDESLDWKNVEKHCLKQAHKELAFVTEAALCIDGSVVTAGLDGALIRWRFSRGEGRCTAECEMIQQAGAEQELVMSCVSTMNGFGVFSQTTTRKTGVEARDMNDISGGKFSATARRTFLGLYIIPEVFGDTENAIMCAVQRISSKECQAVCMWDIELFLDHHDYRSDGLVDRLAQRCDELLGIHAERGEGMRPGLYYQRGRALYWLCGMISQYGNGQYPHMEITRTKVRNSLLCAHYTRTLISVRDSGTSIDDMNALERQALECMCQFLSSTSSEYVLAQANTHELVVQIRELLHPFLARGETIAPVCVICAPLPVPLVADGHEAGTFFCLRGDYFDRCVMTGLPVSEVVPYTCGSCEGRGIALEKGMFEWVTRRGYCSICNCRLLLSKVESIY